MTFKELAEWVKTTKKLDEQVIVALEEDKEPDGEEVVVGVANKVCYLPFTAYTIKEKSRTIKGKPWPEETSSRLCIHIWADEVAKTVEMPYTWQQLVDWVNTLEDPTIEATALAAWHMCYLKPLQNGMLYAYEVD
jgi:hypothetical protein